MKLLRREQIKLTSKPIKKGLTNIVERSFVEGEDFFFRHYKDEVLELKVKFSKIIPSLKVVLHSDITGEWGDHNFEDLGDGVNFKINLNPNRCGTFRFKIKYSNNDNQWYWDNIPHMTVLVDPPALRGLKMYTLIPNVSGSIKDWCENLDHIKALGFNAVHLLPITELDQSESPYSAKELFQIDEFYRNKNEERQVIDQWEEFVEKAKNLGIKICVDLVMNHIGITSNMAKYCPDWIATDKKEEDSLKRAGCWDNFKWVSWRDLALIKYDHPHEKVKKEIWSYMKDYALFWANYASYTGGLIRLDNLHSINLDFFEYLSTELSKEYPELTVFAELFTDHDNIKKLTLGHSINLLLATPWVSPFADQMRNFINFLHENDHKLKYFFPLNSHDSGTPAKEYGHVDATISRYVTCALMGTGMTGITQGVEFGVPEKIQFIGKQNKWHFHGLAWGRDFCPFFTKIHEVFDTYPDVFQCGKNIEFIDDNHSAILGCFRHQKQNKEKGFIILANFDTTNSYKFEGVLSDRLYFMNGKKYFDSYHSDFIQVENNSFTTNLKPLSFRLFEV